MYLNRDLNELKKVGSHQVKLIEIGGVHQIDHFSLFLKKLPGISTQVQDFNLNTPLSAVIANSSFALWSMTFVI